MREANGIGHRGKAEKRNDKGLTTKDTKDGRTKGTKERREKGERHPQMAQTSQRIHDVKHKGRQDNARFSKAGSFFAPETLGTLRVLRAAFLCALCGAFLVVCLYPSVFSVASVVNS